MMKCIFLFFMFTCVSTVAEAQVNLVQNGSFEKYKFCPRRFDQIGFANNWSGLDTTWAFSDSLYSSFTWCLPDFCNTCSDTLPIPYVSVPKSIFFYQTPRSGKGFAQLRIFIDTSITHSNYDYRDYLQGKLYKSLSSGINYCVSFYVSRAEKSSDAIQQIGAYLDNGSIDNTDSANCPLPKTSCSPQVSATNIIYDTISWVKIQSSFIATGTEKFITIGNFFDYLHTNSTIVVYTSGSGDGATYYLIDDVSVIASDAIADAGSDKAGAVGDSIHIGTNEEGMPCTWYLAGDTTHPVGYGGGIKVRPMATGTYHYVVMLDLCGHVTWDTMTLYVWPAGVNNGSMTQWLNCSMYPSPMNGLLHIDGAVGCEVGICNPVGQLVYSGLVTKKEEVINVEQLPRGSYYVVVTDMVTGYRVVRQVVKE